MKLETLKKAKELQNEIDELWKYITSLRIEHCNGVGFVRECWKNSRNTYRHELYYDRHDNGVKIDSLIAEAGIEAMYEKAIELRVEKEKELDSL